MKKAAITILIDYLFDNSLIIDFSSLLIIPIECDCLITFPDLSAVLSYLSHQLVVFSIHLMHSKKDLEFQPFLIERFTYSNSFWSLAIQQIKE